MNFLKRRWTKFFLVLAIAIGGSFVIYFKTHYSWTNDAMIDGYAVDSSSNVTEKVINIFVEEGDEVQKGQLLAVLRNNVPLAEKDQAIAKIEAAKQDLFLRN